jgi:hypothetical protein
MLPTIATECSQYLSESEGRPLIKNLPSRRDAFLKVKVRKKAFSDQFSENFNGAFASEIKELLQRSMIAYGGSLITEGNAGDVEPFYVFPINGYRYTYNPVVANSNAYKETFDVLKRNVGDAAPGVLQEILKTGYVFDKLAEGIGSGAEIIFYGIPYYYALKKSVVDDYENFMYR